MNISNATISPNYIFTQQTRWCIVEMSDDKWVRQPATIPRQVYDTHQDAEIELGKMNNPLMVILEMSISYRLAFQ